MRKLLIVVAVLLTGLVLWHDIQALGRVEASGPCVAPKAWGALRGVTWQSGPSPLAAPVLAFEDEAGTIRLVHGGSCKAIGEIVRQ
jgi:hypothetical protein